MSVENRGNEHIWRIQSPISDIPDIGDFIRRSPGVPGAAIAQGVSPAYTFLRLTISANESEQIKLCQRTQISFKINTEN